MARLSKPCNPHPELEVLLAQVKNMPPMTKEQIETQRRSWVIGEMLIENPWMTWEYAERIYEEVRG